MPTLSQVILVALFATFIVILATKWGIREYIILKAPELLSKLASCDFCLGFWLSILICSVLFMLEHITGLQFFIIPTLAAPIIRFLL